MLSSRVASAKKINHRAANVTLPDAASPACEKNLAAEVAQMRTAQWLRDNRAATEAWNAHVEANGLPLALYRQF